jgi:hypothetical protein
MEGGQLAILCAIEFTTSDIRRLLRHRPGGLAEAYTAAFKAAARRPGSAAGLLSLGGLLDPD